MLPWVGLCCLGLGWLIFGLVGLFWVGLGYIGLCWVWLPSVGCVGSVGLGCILLDALVVLR